MEAWAPHVSKCIITFMLLNPWVISSKTLGEIIWHLRIFHIKLFTSARKVLKMVLILAMPRIQKSGFIDELSWHIGQLVNEGICKENVFWWNLITWAELTATPSPLSVHLSFPELSSRGDTLELSSLRSVHAVPQCTWVESGWPRLTSVDLWVLQGVESCGSSHVSSPELKL